MAKIIQLKIRHDGLSRLVPLDVIRNILSGKFGPEPERAKSDTEIIAEFRRILDENVGEIHDKRWLEAIANWMPDKAAFTIVAPWLKLADRIGNLDETREGPFTLSDANVESIWKRLNDPNFNSAIIRLSPALASFILEFEKVIGRRFSDQVDDEKELQEGGESEKKDD